MRFYREWNKKLTLSFDLQNIFDNEFIDKKEVYLPGGILNWKLESGFSYFLNDYFNHYLNHH